MIIHDFLSEEEIETILNWRVIYSHGTTNGAKAQHKRVVEKANIDLTREKFGWLKNKILNASIDYNKKYFNFNLFAGVSQVDLLRYEGGGKYDWHQDVNWNRTEHHRKITMIIQLSDSEDYDGGGLEFKDKDVDLSEFRRKGSALLFPSTLVHRIVPLTSGKRQSVVAWVNGSIFTDKQKAVSEILKCKF